MQPLKVDAVPKQIERPDETPTVPNPQPISTLPVDWKVVRGADTLPANAALFCLTDRGYENLSKNHAEALRWVREAMWRLRYYRGDLDAIPATAE